MSKLTVDQKTIMLLFSDKKSDFLIPDYQRPYAWEEEQCQTLWDDVFSFAFPNSNKDEFNDDDEYFLGSIVTFENENKKLEVIDGQQRLTTIMLLLRAFYVRFDNGMSAQAIRNTKDKIAKCIWKTDRYDVQDFNILKINSEVATDNDKEEFLDILKTGVVKKEHKSNYANNFRFFQQKIEEFLLSSPTEFAHLPAVILENCILLPIEAESQDTALRIFSTLNDRGLPLSDADIFKAQFYKYYSDKSKKDQFIKKWKDLEEICEQIFHPTTGTPMDELFTRYMYFVRAKQGNKSTTTEALRKFYEKDKYSILKNDETFENLITLANFWQDVANQASERFSEKVLRKLFVLNYAPNGMWNYFVSVYFMQNKQPDDKLDDEKFDKFLTTIIAFIWTYAIINPGVNALRTPIFAEMLKVVNNEAVDFAEHKFDENTTKTAFENYAFNNGRPITKSMVTWWAFANENQSLPHLETIFEIEHIFAKNRQKNDSSLKNPKNLESLGNKALLEKRINIRASDYRFADKKRYYNGEIKGKDGQLKPKTAVKELLELATRDDFSENNIENRNKLILGEFIKYLKETNLIK